MAYPHNSQPTPVTVPATYGTLIGHIFDTNGHVPVQAHVSAIGSDQQMYFAEDGLTYVKENWPNMDRHFTTVGNTFTIHLPPGLAVLTLKRGKEYKPVVEEVYITAGETTIHEFMLSRWINMAADGWYSGDMHVHRSLRNLSSLVLAEDLNVAVPQSVWNDRSRAGPQSLTQSRRDPDLEQYLKTSNAEGEIQADPTHLFCVLGEESERYSGAVMLDLFGKEEIPLTGYGVREPTDLHFIQLARDRSGYIDIEKPFWRESHINVALGKADFIGLVHNHFWYKDGLNNTAWGWDRTEIKQGYPDDLTGLALYTCDLYYAFLNCGFKVMPSAGSASGVMPSPIGYCRVYAKVDGRFSSTNWFHALKTGPSFATNGPMLIATVNDKPTGSTIKLSNGVTTLNVACDIASLNPIDRLEIIRDGTVIYTTVPHLVNNRATVEANIPVCRSGWIAVRCFERRTDTVRFAHTAPVWFTLPGSPFVPDHTAVEYFIGRTKVLMEEADRGYVTGPEYRNSPFYEHHLKTIGFSNDQQKNETMKVYRKALTLFEEILNQARTVQGTP